jgi:hypothetical protein
VATECGRVGGMGKSVEGTSLVRLTPSVRVHAARELPCARALFGRNLL